MILKLYLISIIIYWVALIVSNNIIKIQLKREGYIFPKANLVLLASSYFVELVFSIIPVINLILATYLLVTIDKTYDKAKMRLKKKE